LLAVISTLFIGFNVWHIAIEVTWSGLLDYIAEAAIPEAIATKNKLQYSIIWIAFWYIGVIAFLWVLLKLPPFLQITDMEDAPMDEEDSH
jgi:hypothetical protein